jgi:hypothetical protein
MSCNHPRNWRLTEGFGQLFALNKHQIPAHRLFKILVRLIFTKIEPRLPRKAFVEITQRRDNDRLSDVQHGGASGRFPALRGRAPVAIPWNRKSRPC